MAQYKVPQDVEADDKLIGPFSPKQSVFVGLAISGMVLAYMLGQISVFLAVLPVPFILAFLILGFPWRKDQPTDVYIAALLRFWLKPKKRLWDQEGIADHVLITAPKNKGQIYSDGLSRSQVNSRLDALAGTLDSRGWQGGVMQTSSYNTDRLVDATIAPSAVPLVDERQLDDVLDTQNAHAAQIFDRLEQEARKKPIEKALEFDAQQTQAMAAAQQTTTPTEQTAQAPAQPAGPAPGTKYVPDPASGNRTVSEVAAQAAAVQSTQPNQERVKLEDLHFEPYPTMNQKVIKPMDEQSPPTESSADIIDSNPKPSQPDGSDSDTGSLDEGGEIKLH